MYVGRRSSGDSEARRSSPILEGGPVNRSIASGILSVVGGKVVILVVTALTTPLLYRLLGASRFGEYSFLLSVFALYMIFVSSGITDGVRKFLAEDRPIANWSELVVGFYFRLAILTSVVGAALLVVAARGRIVELAFGPGFATYFHVLAVLVLAAQFRSYARKTLMGFGLERYSEPLQILDTVAFVALAIPLVALGHGVIGALAGRVLASALVAVVGLALVHRQVSLRCIFSRPPSRFPSRTMLTFNSMSVVLVLLLTSLYHVDIIMLQRFRESAQVGHYRAALTLAEFLWFVPLALQTVYVHSTSELWSQNRHRQISELASRTTRYTFLLTAVMAVGLAALADVAVPIYFGPDATPAIEPLLLLLPGALGFALARPILAVAQGKGTLRYPVVATGLAAVINVALNALLIPRYGMHGAAVATSVGYGSMFVFHCLSARLVGFRPLVGARIGQATLATGLSSIPIFAMATNITKPWLALVVVPPAGFVIFVFCALLTGALGLGELREVLAAFPGPVEAPASPHRQPTNDRLGFTVGDWFQTLLLVVGMVLLVSGAIVALFRTGAV